MATPPLRLRTDSHLETSQEFERINDWLQTIAATLNLGTGAATSPILIIQDQGADIAPVRQILNFTGPGVSAADDGTDSTDVTIPGYSDAQVLAIAAPLVHTHVAADVTDFSAAVVALLIDMNIPDTLTLSNITQIASRDHGALDDLLADDHTQYLLLAGRSGGQAIVGGTAASNSLTLKSTSHATRGSVQSIDNFLIGEGAAGIDYTLTMHGETNDGILTWMEDEDYFKFSDDVLFSTTEKLYFHDTGIFIHASSDGNALFESDTNLTLRGNTLTTIGVAGDTTLGDGTLRVLRPATDQKIDLGTTSFRFNDLCLGGNIDILSGNIITDTTTGMMIGTGSTQKLGLWGATPIVRPAAYTQTYSTATRTHTQTTMTDPAAYGAGANGYSTAAMAQAIHAEVIALRANMIVVQGMVNSLVDDHQAMGMAS